MWPPYSRVAMREDLARRARRDVLRAAHEGVDWVTMVDLLAAAIGKAVPFGFHCWGPIDPATLLFTGATAREATSPTQISEGLELLPHLEYGIPDVIQWAFLARTPSPVGILSRATHGNPELSPRYQQLLRPHGLERELRVSLVSDGGCWGAMGLYRGPGQPDFDDAEADFLASLSAPIADGFRRALLVTTQLPDELPDGPGLVVLDHRGQVESVTAAALRWIEELVEPPHQSPLPMVVGAVAARARRAGEDGDNADASARARASTRSGRWLVVHAMRMHGGGEGRIAVIIEPAHPHELAPLIVAAYGLSDRERHVTQLVLQGAATDQIARRLHISPLTVQDHLKQIFDKTGVRSRRELVTKICFDHYWPAVSEVVSPMSAE
jgi:DNA-binding CsgD family transcriptional regulator